MVLKGDVVTEVTKLKQELDGEILSCPRRASGSTRPPW